MGVCAVCRVDEGDGRKRRKSGSLLTFMNGRFCGESCVEVAANLVDLHICPVASLPCPLLIQSQLVTVRWCMEATDHQSIRPGQCTRLIRFLQVMSHHDPLQCALLS